MRQRQFLLESSGGFPMTPMIDIVLQLLLFFMLISRYMPPSLAVTLPEAGTAVPDDRPAVSVSIDQTGLLSVDGTVTDWSQLPGQLAGRDPETQVRIAADKDVPYDYVVRALDAAAQAGLTRIALEAQPPAPATPPAATAAPSATPAATP